MSGVFNFEEYECGKSDYTTDHHHGGNGWIVPCGGGIGPSSNHYRHCNEADSARPRRGTPTLQDILTEDKGKGSGEQEQANSIRLNNEALRTSTPSGFGRVPIFRKHTELLRYMLSPKQNGDLPSSENIRSTVAVLCLL
jgi:hypothetical protein